MLFSKKKQEKAIYKGRGIKNVNFLTQTTRETGNVSGSTSHIVIVFQLEDETLLSFSVSERKAGDLMKDREGILTYRGSKFISFKVV